MLNRLLENLRFCQLTQTMAYALEPDQTAGVMSYDNILAHGESLFLEYMAPSIKIKRELKKDSQKSQEALFDNFAGTHVDMLLAQYEEEEE